MDGRFRCVEKSDEERDLFCNEFVNGVCIKCSVGAYFDPQKKCKVIPIDCADFNTQDEVCERCFSGYELSDKLECVKSILGVGDINCNEFVNGVCVKCSVGSFFNSRR